MWYSAVFLLLTCNYCINAQFMPPFQGCGCNGPPSPNLNYLPTNCRCPNFTPFNNPCFNFPSFCPSNFNNPKCSFNLPCSNNVVPVASESSSSSSTQSNELSCVPLAESKLCQPISSNPTSQSSCPSESTPCPVTENVTETVPAPVEVPTTTTTTTESPIETVIDVVEDVIEVVEEVEEVVETVIDEIITTTTCPPCTTTECPEITTPPAICEVTVANNPTTPCIPISSPCPSIGTNSCDNSCNSSQSVIPIASPNIKPCGTLTVSSCPACQFSNSLPVQCTCMSTSPNPCISSLPNPCVDSFTNTAPKLCIGPQISQCASSDQSNFFINTSPNLCVTPYPNQCLGSNQGNSFINASPNPCIGPYSNQCPCSNQNINPYPNQCMNPNANQFNNAPCPSPCPSQLFPSCQTQNLCPDQFINNVPCELSTFSQIPNSYSCMPPNTCCSAPFNGANFDLPMGQPIGLMDCSNTLQKYPFCSDTFSNDCNNCGNNVLRQSNFNCQPNYF